MHTCTEQRTDLEERIEVGVFLQIQVEYVAFLVFVSFSTGLLDHRLSAVHHTLT